MIINDITNILSTTFATTTTTTTWGLKHQYSIKIFDFLIKDIVWVYVQE